MNQPLLDKSNPYVKKSLLGHVDWISFREPTLKKHRKCATPNSKGATTSSSLHLTFPAPQQWLDTLVEPANDPDEKWNPLHHTASFSCKPLMWMTGFHGPPQFATLVIVSKPCWSLRGDNTYYWKQMPRYTMLINKGI